MFLYDQWSPVPIPEAVKDTRKSYKKVSEYGHVKDMAAPVIARKEKVLPLGPPSTGKLLNYEYLSSLVPFLVGNHRGLLLMWNNEHNCSEIA